MASAPWVKSIIFEHGRELIDQATAIRNEPRFATHPAFAERLEELGENYLRIAKLGTEAEQDEALQTL